jgi:hypothetical protein
MHALPTLSPVIVGWGAESEPRDLLSRSALRENSIDKFFVRHVTDAHLHARVARELIKVKRLGCGCVN